MRGAGQWAYEHRHISPIIQYICGKRELLLFSLTVAKNGVFGGKFYVDCVDHGHTPWRAIAIGKKGSGAETAFKGTFET